MRHPSPGRHGPEGMRVPARPGPATGRTSVTWPWGPWVAVRSGGLPPSAGIITHTTSLLHVEMGILVARGALRGVLAVYGALSRQPGA